MNNAKKTIVAGIVVCAISGSVQASQSTTSLETVDKADVLCVEQVTDNERICAIQSEKELANNGGSDRKWRHVDVPEWMEWLIKGSPASAEQDKNFS